MKRLLRYIIYTNIIVALSAALLSAGFCFRKEIHNWWLYGLFSFFATMTVYNGQRLFKTKENKATEWLIWVKKHNKLLIGLVLFSFLTALLCFFLIDKNRTLIYLLFTGVSCISILYVVRIKGKNIRELPYIKIHLISFTWVIVLILFPLINESLDINLVTYALGFYFYVLAVTIPFDIRDLKYDLPEQKTIPQLIGVRKAKILSVLLLLTFVLIFVKTNSQIQFNLFFWVTIALQLFLLLMMNKKRGDFYCAGLIDGAIGLMGLSLFF